MLERRDNIVLALQILFYIGKEEKRPEDDYGSLSVIMDCDELEDEDVSSATEKFTKGLNCALLTADATEKGKAEANEQDALTWLSGVDKMRFYLPIHPICRKVCQVSLLYLKQLIRGKSRLNQKQKRLLNIW